MHDTLKILRAPPFHIVTQELVRYKIREGMRVPDEYLLKN